MTIHFLHIGKTGGNSIKDYWRALDHVEHERLVFHHHSSTAMEILKDNPTARLAFVFRDPVERFVSGFMSRLRCGRPRNNSAWSAEEATSFLFFATPSELAQALSGEDDRLYSAACFAMRNISHLHRGYVHHFGDVNTLEQIRSRIVFTCELSALNDHYTELFGKIADPPEGGWPQMRKSHASQSTILLDDLSRKHLEGFWHEEFALYDALIAISNFCPSLEECKTSPIS